jgi:pyruvate/2-oxoglutarate dehydrogenase complex dihydrolipoamide acyltransferase (E2) component
MQATLSVDHRLVDGIVAARFLATWKEMLENPTRLTLEPPEKIG